MPRTRLLCRDMFGTLAHMFGDEDRHFSERQAFAKTGVKFDNEYSKFRLFQGLQLNSRTTVASSNASASFAFPNWTSLLT